MLKFQLPLFVLLPLLIVISCNGEGVNLVGTTTTRTDVTDIAAITKDLRDMANHCSQGDTVNAKKIYFEANSAKFSLHQLATDEKYRNADITFAFQMLGMTGGNVEDTADEYYQLYLSKYVEYLFDEDQCELGTVASRALILWLHTTHKLWDIVRSCRLKGDPYYDNDYNNLNNLITKPDEFIAYWIGGIEGGVMDGILGHSLFSDANVMADKFDTNLLSGGSLVNWNIIEGYESLSGILSSGNACTEPNSLAAMWPVVQKIQGQMLVPHFQKLIYAMLEENMEEVAIYSRIVVPQLIQCRNSNFKKLKEYFIDNEYHPNNFHASLRLLQDSFPCLGLDCEDIGVPSKYYDDNALECDYYDESYIPTLGGYPTTSLVGDHSRIDLDIYHIKLLTQFDNPEYWKTAKFIYMYGKNSLFVDYYVDDDGISMTQYRSLQSFATSLKRRNALFFNDFESYFGDPSYADSTIMFAFDDKGAWGGKSIQQRAAVIFATLQAQVMFMHVLTELENAIDECGSDNRFEDDGGEFVWDQIAAYIIGSLEGSETGGSKDYDDGVQLWNLGNNRGIEFGRRNADGFAITNEEILTLLLSGKGQIESNGCVRLRRTAESIAHMLLIPVIQTVVKYAIANEFESPMSPDEDIAYGDVFAKSIIPVYNRYNAESALTVQRNMLSTDSFDKLVEDGPQAVADAYLGVADDFNIGCEYIGQSFEVDGCLNKLNIKTSSASENTFFPCLVLLFSIVTLALYI